MYALNEAVEKSSAAPIPEVKKATDRYLASSKAKERLLINLAPGHPAHAPHQEVLSRASVAAGDAEAYHYGLGKGQQALREAVMYEMKDLYRDLDDNSEGDSVDLELEHVTITSGANQAFYVTVQCLAQHGDQIIIPTPWFFNHEMALRQLGTEPVPLPCSPEKGFLPDAQAAEKLITQRTKAIILCTPNNPTGACYPSTTLEAFAALASKHKIALIVDETYRDLLPSGWEGENTATGRRPRPHSLFGKKVANALGCHWSDILVHLYSFSKSHSVCGARLGALVASPVLMEQADKIIDTVTICPEQIAQPALAWSIPNTKVWREETRAHINLLNQTFRDSITSIEEGWAVGSSGSFYAFVQHPFEGHSSKAVAIKMIEEAGVSCLPGSFFIPADEEGSAGDRWLRFSVPNVSIEQLKQVGERLRGLKM